MDSINEPYSGYNTGADMWRDNVLNYGVDEAIVICNRYMYMQLKSEISDSEKEFCRELFTAMYEATTGKTDADKSVYSYNFQEANERGEVSVYHESRQRNMECAKNIDDVIRASCYKTNFYHLEIAAMIAVQGYGFARVNRVLAFNLQKRPNDGRYSSANKRWVQTFTVPEQAFSGSYLDSHACLVDGFTDYIRELRGYYEYKGDEKT